MRSENIPVVDTDGNRTSLFISFKCALAALQMGKIEQVFDNQFRFVGVLLLQSVPTVKQQFRVSNSKVSDTSLSMEDSEANVGIASKPRVKQVQAKVRAWPNVYDRNAVVIAAGKVHRPCRS